MAIIMSKLSPVMTRLGALSTTRTATQILCVSLISRLVHEGCAKTIHQISIQSQALRQTLGKLPTHPAPAIAVASVLGLHSILSREVAVVTVCQYCCAEIKTVTHASNACGQNGGWWWLSSSCRSPRKSRRSKVLEALGEERKGESADGQMHQVFRRYVASKNATSFFFRANHLISLLFLCLQR